MKRCTWDPERGWLTHAEEPCPKSHCALRGRCTNHVDANAGHATCPACIGRVRKDLASIVTLYALALPDEAAESGIDSEAFNLAGPASPYSPVLAEADETHPYTLLGHWDLALRETYGPATDLTITMSRSADYLTGLLGSDFPHGNEFEAFAKSIAACRARLEAVIHDSRAPERGAHCPRCAADIEADIVRKLQDEHAPRLRKRYASHAPLKAGQVRCGKPGCKTCDGSHDTWHCPDETEHWWSERDYRDRVSAQYVEHADALPSRELADRIGLPASTIRRWAAKRRVPNPNGVATYAPPLLKAAGKSADGRITYRVDDAKRLAEERVLDTEAVP